MITDQVRLSGRYVPEKINLASLSKEWGSFYVRDCPGQLSGKLIDLLKSGVRLTYQGRLTSENEDLWHGEFWNAVADADSRLTVDFAGKVRLADYLGSLPEGGAYAREMGVGLEGGWSETLVYRTAAYESRLNLETGEFVQREL